MIALDMNMPRFRSVAGVEMKAIRSDDFDCGHTAMMAGGWAFKEAPTVGLARPKDWLARLHRGVGSARLNPLDAD